MKYNSGSFAWALREQCQEIRVNQKQTIISVSTLADSGCDDTIDMEAYLNKDIYCRKAAEKICNEQGMIDGTLSKCTDEYVALSNNFGVKYLLYVTRGSVELPEKSDESNVPFSCKHLLRHSFWRYVPTF